MCNCGRNNVLSALGMLVLNVMLYVVVVVVVQSKYICMEVFFCGVMNRWCVIGRDGDCSVRLRCCLYIFSKRII